APLSTKTEALSPTSFLTDSGISATRSSPFCVSRKTTIFIYCSAGVTINSVSRRVGEANGQHSRPALCCSHMPMVDSWRFATPTRRGTEHILNWVLEKKTENRFGATLWLTTGGCDIRRDS